jgi:hypothetical protein
MGPKRDLSNARKFCIEELLMRPIESIEDNKNQLTSFKTNQQNHLWQQQNLDHIPMPIFTGIDHFQFQSTFAICPPSILAPFSFSHQQKLYLVSQKTLNLLDNSRFHF